MDDFTKLYPNLYFSSLRMDECYPNGESPLEFYNRIKEALIDIVKKYKEKKILIVTHGGVITIIQCLINGWKYSNLLKITVPYGTLLRLT